VAKHAYGTVETKIPSGSYARQNAHRCHNRGYEHFLCWETKPGSADNGVDKWGNYDVLAPTCRTHVSKHVHRTQALNNLLGWLAQRCSGGCARQFFLRFGTQGAPAVMFVLWVTPVMWGFILVMALAAAAVMTYKLRTSDHQDARMRTGPQRRQLMAKHAMDVLPGLKHEPRCDGRRAESMCRWVCRIGSFSCTMLSLRGMSALQLRGHGVRAHDVHTTL